MKTRYSALRRVFHILSHGSVLLVESSNRLTRKMIL